MAQFASDEVKTRLSVFTLFLIVSVHDHGLFGGKAEAAEGGRRPGPYYWPSKVIPYVIVPKNFAQEEIEAVKEVIHDLEKHTCLKFIPRKKQKAFIKFQRTFEPYCQSFPGYEPNTTIEIRFGQKACFKRGYLYHEFLHALGFNHEHQRADRDKYIHVDWSKIPKHLESQFQTMSTKEFPIHGLYDYYSILHYPLWLHGTTIKTREYQQLIPHGPRSKGLNENAIGEGDAPTKLDFIKIRRAYKCDKKGNQKGGSVPKQGKKKKGSKQASGV